MCRFQNLVADLLQETPYFFAALLKADSDSRVNRAEKKSFVEEPLAKFWLFYSVGETDKYKKYLSEGTPCKIAVVVFSWID